MTKGLHECDRWETRKRGAGVCSKPLPRRTDGVYGVQTEKAACTEPRVEYGSFHVFVLRLFQRDVASYHHHLWTLCDFPPYVTRNLSCRGLLLVEYKTLSTLSFRYALSYLVKMCDLIITNIYQLFPALVIIS